MPASRSYSIVEPHPSAPSHSYIMTGRGGAGNHTKVPSTITRGSDASGPASLAALPRPRHSFTTGRGGAGNAHPPSERAIFSFDEELEREMSREQHAAPVYHVGRGGAGNVYGASKTESSSRLEAYLDGSARRRTPSDDSASGKSTSSAESGADVATRQFKKGWQKVMGR